MYGGRRPRGITVCGWKMILNCVLKKWGVRRVKRIELALGRMEWDVLWTWKLHNVFFIVAFPWIWGYVLTLSDLPFLGLQFYIDRIRNWNPNYVQYYQQEMIWNVRHPAVTRPCWTETSAWSGRPDDAAGVELLSLGVPFRVIGHARIMSCFTASVQARAERSCTLNKRGITCCNIAAAGHCKVYG